MLYTGRVMATYKVLQDIEAEDKLLGPLTLKQFIFAAVTLLIGFIEFRLALSPIPMVIKLPMIVTLLLPMLLFGFMAAPISREQPNDIWLLARLRFLFKPRRRIWDQNGVSDLVQITVPKRDARIYTNGLTENEVSSRLEALANTLDSRGWAIKNVNVNLFAQPGYDVDANEDRLVAPSNLPQDVPIIDVQAADDMLDERNNPTAAHLNEMVEHATEAKQQALRRKVASGDITKQDAPPADYWFMNGPAEPPKVDPGLSTFAPTNVAPGTTTSAAPEPTAEEKALIDQAVQDEQAASVYKKHLHTILPISEQKAAEAAAQTAAADAAKTGTVAPNPAILELAGNDDLNVATIARRANRITHGQGDSGEVVISLR
jgi:hypothetical protein